MTLKKKEKTGKLTENEPKDCKEIKRLEDKGQKLLEYFSKDELVNKVKCLEEDIEKKETLLKDLQEWKQKYLFLQAEFENAQKRWNKDRRDLRKQYTASVLRNFLPLYDSFKKALDSNAEDESLKQFFNQFLNAYKSYKAEPLKLEKHDKFDYKFHEALTTLENDDLPENSIIDIIQDGWMLEKDVLRYAKVVVSKKPKPPAPEPIPEEELDSEQETDIEKESEKSDENSEDSN